MEENSVKEEAQQQASQPNDDAHNLPDYFQQPDNPKPKKNFFSSHKKAIAIVCVVVVFLGIIGSMGGVPQDEYDELEQKYEDVQAQLDEANTALENKTRQYDTYKEKMSKFEGMTDEEIDALIAEVDQKLAEQQAAEEQAAAEEAARQQAIASATTEQKNALDSAKSYLSVMAFSHTGLIEQLEYEGYSAEAATYAADNCGADWNAQAAAMAQSYMDTMSFSRQGLIDQLVFEGFSQEQAEYGVSAVGY